LNKFTLKYELDLDFVLIALTVPLKDYRLCFQINKHLNIQFQRIEELVLSSTSETNTQYFSRYYYNSFNPESEYFLVANKGNEGFLIPEMKTVDFFIIIKNFIDEEDLEKLIGGLHRLPEVQVAAEVDPKKLKSKENLIF
jgi:hypothetical protein